MQNQQPNINCKLFKEHEPQIRTFTDKINLAKGLGEKVKYAEQLRQEAESLLQCPEYKKDDALCSSCQTIADFRKQTAELIIKTKKLI